MADDDQLALVRQLYDAFERRAIANISLMLAGDVVQRMPGNNRFSGEHKGRPTVMYLYDQLVDGTAGTLKRVPEAFFTAGDRVAVVTRVTARRQGFGIDVRQCWLFRIADGRFAEIDVLSEDEFTEDAFWA